MSADENGRGEQFDAIYVMDGNPLIVVEQDGIFYSVGAMPVGPPLTQNCMVSAAPSHWREVWRR